MPSKFADKEKLEKACAESTCYLDVITKFFPDVNRQRGSGHYRTLARYIILYGINVDHFTDERKLRGLKRETFNNTIPLDDILSGKTPYTNTVRLKQRLVEAGIKDYACESCGIKEWQGERLTLQLEHVDGDSTNNKLENLKILCPNCHSQTPTYSRKKNGPE